MPVLATVASLLTLLMQEPDEAAIRKLVEQLGADFLEDREAARRSLEKVGDKWDSCFIEGLASTDHRIRRNCLELLKAHKSKKAVDRAAELFHTDEDASVRDAAFRLIQVLGKDAEDHLIAALASPALEHRRGAIQSLSEMKSEKCVGRMSELYDREQDKDVKAAAFACLKSLGKPAQGFLLKCLASGDANLRGEALDGLRELKDDSVLKAVGDLFANETEVKTLDKATEYLKRSGQKAEPYYLKALRSPSEQGRQRAIEGLQVVKSDLAIDPVAEALQNDSSEAVREEASKYLISQGLKAEAPLIKALANSNVKVRLLAIQALGGIKSQKPLAEIAKLFREDKDKEVHKKSFEYLEKLGIAAEKELLFALSDESKEIRRRAILALGNANSQAAISPLIDFLGQLDEPTKRVAADALVRIGPKAMEALERAADEGKIKKRSDDAEAVTAESILALFHQEEVEKLLDALVTEEGGIGFYEGQFRELHRFGKEKAIKVLLLIVGSPDFHFRLTERRDRVTDYRIRMRELAIMALGDFGDPRAIETLKKALKESGPPGADSTPEELMVALYRLGETKPLEAYVKKAQSDASTALGGENKDEGCRILFSLGLVLNRVGRRREAEETYLRLIQAIEEHKLETSRINILDTASYNLACLFSLRGEKTKAVEWLEKSARAGFKDRQWIKMDRDLDGIRNEPAYLKLLSDDKLFESRPEDKP